MKEEAGMLKLTPKLDKTKPFLTGKQREKITRKGGAFAEIVRITCDFCGREVRLGERWIGLNIRNSLKR